VNAEGAGAFRPAIVRLQQTPPSPLGRTVLWTVLSLVAATLAWAALARLDIVAVAEGKLVPAGYLKIVQPAEQGVVREILVGEGESVAAGQVLARMDAVVARADRRSLESELAAKRLSLARVVAQLEGKLLAPVAGIPEPIYLQVRAQYEANVSAHANALAQERAVLARAHHERDAAAEVREKLVAVLPHYRAQDRAFEKLAKDGFAGALLHTDKQRERIEKERDLKSQESIIAAAQSTISQSEKRLAQIDADYRRALQAERVELSPQVERLNGELAKLTHRADQMELRAPQDGVVKDLATHTPGTVVSPGTILMTLVPAGERLRAEVWLSNDDVGFVHATQAVRLKLAAFQFQKYGMLDGKIAQVSADATESPNPNTRSGGLAGRDRAAGPLAFRTLVDLAAQQLEVDGRRYPLAPGMQVIAEVHLGERSVLEYFLSPIQRAWHEAARER